jgi:hypothetical protein
MYLALNKPIQLSAPIQFTIPPEYKSCVEYCCRENMGKILPLGSYFYKAPKQFLPQYGTRYYEIKSIIVVAWDWLMNKSWRLHLEGYLQQLTDIPIVNDISRTFWLLNMQDGYANEALISKGKGQNIGADLTLKKFFSKGWFLLTGFFSFQFHLRAIEWRIIQYTVQ